MSRIVGPAGREPAVVTDQLWMLIDAVYVQAAYRRAGDVERGIGHAVGLARTVVAAAVS